MFYNYLKTTLRNLRRYKINSIITIFGLAAGMMCALFIFLFAEHELSHDQFHDNLDNIYQVLAQSDIKNNPVTPVPLAPYLQEHFPEITDVSRYHWFWGETILEYEQNMFFENGISLVDPGFFRIFNFEFIKGSPQSALSNPNSIVMTESTAQKYFGNEDPMGRSVTLNQNEILTVSGVIKDLPDNSSMRFDMLMPIQFTISKRDEWYTEWNNLFVYTFIKCRENVSAESLQGKISGLISRHVSNSPQTLSLLPFKERYFAFYSDKTTVIIFLSAALFIILIAAFNYMNLCTAFSIRRSKEIGMRKVLGAQRKQIVLQHLGESLLLALIAAVFAVVLFYFLLPVFKTISGLDIEVPAPLVLYAAVSMALFTGLLAGIYPALFLSAFRIVNILKGKQSVGLKGGRLRKGIVVIQFALSILLMSGMIVVYQQTSFIQNKDLGYSRENVVSIPMGGGSEKKYQVFKEQLLNQPGIINVSGTAVALPFFSWRINAFQWEGKDPEDKISISYNCIDYDFIETMGIELAAGRRMSNEFGADKQIAIYINEKLAKLSGLDPAAGSVIMQGDVPLHIAGVIKDFHFTSMYNEIEPLIMVLYPPDVDNVLIRIRPEGKAETLARIKQVWETAIPDYPFQYSFLDDNYNRSLTGLMQTGYLLTAFSVLAVLLSCLGLFGLSSFLAEQKTREIGIRKVHGASVSNIIGKLSAEFLMLVLAANIIVLPAAYYLMNEWLSSFAYKTQVQYSTFLLTAAASILTAFLSLGWKTYQAARANPVKALRYE